MKQFIRFKRWVRQNSKGRGMICHFYIEESEKQKEKNKTKTTGQKQYYTKVDYAFFNLLNDTKDWIVKGTAHHGITDKYGNPSLTPCLNCFEINKAFFTALETLYEEGNSKFELGVIFNKNKLRRHFGVDKVRNVNDWKHDRPRPPKGQCWLYDIPRRKWALYPFNYCQVVRVKLQKTELRELAIKHIPIKTVMGLLVRRQDHISVSRLPKVKDSNIDVFPLL